MLYIFFLLYYFIFHWTSASEIDRIPGMRVVVVWCGDMHYNNFILFLIQSVLHRNNPLQCNGSSNFSFLNTINIHFFFLNIIIISPSSSLSHTTTIVIIIHLVCWPCARADAATADAAGDTYIRAKLAGIKNICSSRE